MSHDEYNAKVQDLQRFCLAAGIEHRVIQERNDPGSTFQVFYGQWRQVGREDKAFSPDRICRYDFLEDAKIRYEVARDLSE